MYTEQLKDLERISQAAGRSPDLVQGGGGNTSVKLDDSLMAVKASGYKLSDITTTDGYVVVNYKNIRDYHERVDLSKDTDYEKESGEFVRSNVVPMEGLKPLRPSVEAGFHSVLLKNVIHTHPVYSNIICCCENGRELVDDLRTRNTVISDLYINPAYADPCDNERGFKPYLRKVSFRRLFSWKTTLSNCRYCFRVYWLHEEVLQTIHDYFNITGPYPEVG